MTVSIPSGGATPGAISAVSPAVKRSALVQWWVLSRRLIAPTFRNGEIATSIMAPVVFTLGFFVPLNTVMTVFGHGLSSYAQFLMPMIVLQALAFAAITSAFRAATDAVDGINRRFASLPMHAGVPLAARLSSNLLRCAIALAGAILCGYIIGFRFYLSPASTVGFVGYAMVIGLGLCLAGDVLGNATRSPEATTQALMLPQLILGMLSVGFAPAQQFPSWVQGFVRNQPVSQWAEGLRALAGDSIGITGSLTWPALLWAVLLVAVFAPMAVVFASRRSS